MNIEISPFVVYKWRHAMVTILYCLKSKKYEDSEEVLIRVISEMEKFLKDYRRDESIRLSKIIELKNNSLKAEKACILSMLDLLGDDRPIERGGFLHRLKEVESEIDELNKAETTMKG